MAVEIRVRLKYNESTGEKEIRIGYEGEGDETPIEHERRHRTVLKTLLGEGILNKDDLDKVVVERVAKEGQRNGPKKETTGGGGERSQEKAQA